MKRLAPAVALIAAMLIAGLPRAGASELLANGGFEDGPAGWSVNSGQLESVPSPVHSGALSGRFTGNGQPTTQFVYQLVNVQPGQSYELSGWAAVSGDAINAVFLRIAWLDAGGQLLLNSDSDWLPQRDGSFYLLPTGPIVSPAAARFARISAYVLGNPNSPFSVHLDDFTFSGPASIPPPPPTPTGTPAPNQTPAPPTATPGSTPKPSPTHTPSPQATGHAATPTPTFEPLVFPQLVNGGFEDLRIDGTPYGWRKQGGEMSAVADPRTDGALALAVTSQTSSTKWVYQTIAVEGGRYYEASVHAFAGHGAESAFIRLSWYAGSDGSGLAIRSTDSEDAATAGGAGFRALGTGAVEAPPDAQSVKVRLMVRPSSADPAAAYFDGVTLRQTHPIAGGIVSGAATDFTSAGRSGRLPRIGAAEAPATGEVTSLAAAAAATPVTLANVRAAADASKPVTPVGHGGDNWAVILAIGTALAAVALGGGYELWQRRAPPSGSDERA